MWKKFKSKEIEAAAPNVGKKRDFKVDFEDSEQDDEGEENTPRLDNLQDELAEIRDNLSKNGGRLNDDILNKLISHISIEIFRKY